MLQHKNKPKTLTREAALLKLQNFCAYQERCQQEVTQKLYDLGVYPNDQEQIIAQLIEDNFLNEERFAIAYAGGKYRIKQWGKIRITLELQQRRISDYCIQKALKTAIENEEDYLKTLNNILIQKNKDYPPDEPNRMTKIAHYALRRGFESELVWVCLKQVCEDEK